MVEINSPQEICHTKIPKTRLRTEVWRKVNLVLRIDKQVSKIFKAKIITMYTEG